MSLATNEKRPTIMDVARSSGVSKTTVSVILNGAPAASRVSKQTAERVMLAAQQLGYRPDWRARALANRQTRMIGVLYAPPMPLVVRGNYEGIMTGIDAVLADRGYHLAFLPLGNQPEDWEKILLEQRVDGALVLSRLREPLAEIIQRSRIHVTLINADTDLPLPAVVVDDYDGAVQSTRHLLDLGHQRIEFLLGQQPPHYSVAQRQDGYAAAMRGAGLQSMIRVHHGDAEQFVAQLARQPHARRPTAIIAYTHFLAVHALRLLWEAGIRVPDDLSLCTFTNAFPVEDTIPPLTTMALPTEEMGRLAAEMVVEQIDSSGSAPRRRVVLPEKLIVRRSTGPPTGGR